MAAKYQEMVQFSIKIGSEDAKFTRKLEVKTPKIIQKQAFQGHSANATL
ncbi:MAG: hypothetical protein OXU94_01155 [Gammaproteobacteria bacterium]|nr:hypothetical protein [Gammaproteobacteria bacterium]